MWNQAWRHNSWSDLQQKWDVIVIGGGITGAGIFNILARHHYKVLLLDAQDFAFGTSSRSSKLVHGGLRYIQNKQFDVVRESVRERERLIKEAPGLVEKLGFLFAGYESLGLSHRALSIGVSIYDLLAPKWEHRTISKQQVTQWEPIIKTAELTGAVQYFDALVDDSRLVLRVIQEGADKGGLALNYAKVSGLLKDVQGQVIGVRVEDQSGANSSTVELQAKVVINATGPWSDLVRADVSPTPRLRKLRGSHLIFSRDKLPIRQAVTMIHPSDHRALFAIPWEGVTMIGTTDLDQDFLEHETRITAQEVDYLLEATNHIFPENKLTADDVISTFSGLRPIIDAGAESPSKASRGHGFWDEDGLVTISGGKLTIFRVMAADVLNFIADRLPNQPVFHNKEALFDQPKHSTKPSFLSVMDWRCLLGRYGKLAQKMVDQADPSLLTQLEPLSNLWAEITWSAKNEAVVHLDDLLLRRIRIGLCLPQGGLGDIEKFKQLAQLALGWDETHWQMEVQRYQEIWQKYYYLP